MFIKDHHDKMVNISEFSSITIEYETFGTGRAVHCIAGHHTFDENKPIQRLQRNVTLGMFPYRKQAESVYEDLMKTIGEGSGLFVMPKMEKLLEDLDTEALNELEAYEAQWLKESGEKPVKRGCGCLPVLVILLSIAGITLFFV